MNGQSEVIAIIGSGVAGLACARRLVDAGEQVVVLDKGRGVGGRVATRRGPDGAAFDHGAQYVTARSTEFSGVLAAACAAGAVDVWEDGSGQKRFVGTPGMSAFAKHLASDLDIRQGVEVVSILREDAKWAIMSSRERFLVGRLVVTVPSPQLARLLEPHHPIVGEIEAARLDPCLTLMVAFADQAPRPFVSRADPEDPLAWIAQNNSKPGRGAISCWVAQAGPAFSASNLEFRQESMVGLMLPMLLDRLGARPQLLHAAAHRWRHARVASPLGRPFVRDASSTLYAGGDWCLGARVEAAWQSGDAIARDIVKAN